VISSKSYNNHKISYSLIVPDHLDRLTERVLEPLELGFKCCGFDVYLLWEKSNSPRKAAVKYGSRDNCYNFEVLHVLAKTLPVDPEG
jgi:hypothetical protein